MINLILSLNLWISSNARRLLTTVILVTISCILLSWIHPTKVVYTSLETPTAMVANTRNFRVPSVCQDSTCKTDYLKFFVSAGSKQYPIPAIRHLIWKNESVSEHFAKQLRTWQRIHPNWSVILWRDKDLKPFVMRYFPAALARFQDLEPHRIMQVDMIRYMLLYKFGGVYADLDYSLSGSLDEYRRFYALVTREPEAHSLQYWGFRWPPRILANPAFMASAPQHPFFRHCIERLQTMPYRKGHPLDFAGPLGLTQLLEEYSSKFPLANFPIETVYIPPSYSFYSYEKNRLSNSKSIHVPLRINSLKESCRKHSGSSAELLKYCKDINNMDPITDSSQPIVAVHDMKKTAALHDNFGTEFYLTNLSSVRSVFKEMHIGMDFV